MNNILVYADTDMNIIDGSSIWVVSILKTLAEDRQNNITLLLKTPIFNQTLIQSVAIFPTIQLVECWEQKNNGKHNLLNHTKKSLSPADALKRINHLDTEHNYTTILVRGANLSPLLLKYRKILSKCIIYHLENGEGDPTIYNRVFPRAKYIACQTHAIKQQLIQMKVPPEKLFILPPMVPNFNKNEIVIKRNGKKLIYSGKLSPQYHTLKIIQAFDHISRKFPDSELLIIGAKYYNKPFVSDFQAKVESMISENRKIRLFMGQTRERAMELIAKSDVCISWRNESLNDHLELSTKLLEYGSLGKPVIVNRTKVHEQLLGKDYPLFANSFDEFIQKVTISFTNDAIYQKAANQMILLSENYTFKEVYRKICAHFTAE
ncbi:glycosyltransferase involved in cell wall biosynthesis [Cytobacillus eiseniae]|uniref:Glycosyltransferase involved in cell wall biosynthesis n=1 Tax=Cytobacillus eiseniae TaxID=762947 RepID=A0ABS4RD69_9BACI|nr:glycosyltransferase [Cytobacillus eiseniae]MBP2240284.1 glycosyltransferase involved in cell wall biosynthesis [Cytobacillus eiseniae]